MKYIEIFKNDIPYEFEIKLGDKVFQIEVNYNNEADFFTFDLSKNGEVLALGEKLTSMRGLFETYRDENFPEPVIVPASVHDEGKRAGYDELNNDVLLYVLED